MARRTWSARGSTVDDPCQLQSSWGEKVRGGMQLGSGGSTPLTLTPTALKLLTVLMRASPRVVSRQDLEREVWTRKTTETVWAPIWSPDGSELMRRDIRGAQSDGGRLGNDLGRQMLADGAGALLEKHQTES